MMKAILLGGREAQADKITEVLNEVQEGQKAEEEQKNK